MKSGIAILLALSMTEAAANADEHAALELALLRATSRFGQRRRAPP